MLAVIAAALALPSGWVLAASSPLIVTPGQTEGPFYPVAFPADMDADLVRVQGQTAQAMGQITHVSGRVLDRKGQIVRGAMVEIWQCDARGIYNHPRAPGQGRHDAGFQGYGRTGIDAAGATPSAPSVPSPIPVARRTFISKCTRRASAVSRRSSTSRASRRTPATACSMPFAIAALARA